MNAISNRLALGVVVGALTIGLTGLDALAQNSRGGGSFGGRGPGGGGRGGPGRGGPMGMMGGPGALPMLAARLDLTDAQRDTVRRIMDAHRDELTALGDRGFAARRAVHAAIIAESVDEAAVRARSADLAVVEADTAVAHARIHAEIWQILTPDQQAQARKLQEEIASRQEQMRERRQQHAGEPGRRRGR